MTTGPGGRVARAMAEYMIQRVEHDMRHRGTDEQRDPPRHVRSGWLGVKNAILFKKVREADEVDWGMRPMRLPLTDICHVICFLFFCLC